MKEHDETQSEDNDLPEQFITVNIEPENLKIPTKNIVNTKQHTSTENSKEPTQTSLESSLDLESINLEPTYKKLPEVPEKVDDLRKLEPTSKKLPEVPKKVDNNGFFSKFIGWVSNKSKKVDKPVDELNNLVNPKVVKKPKPKENQPSKESFKEPSPLKSLAPDLFPLKSLAPESPSLKSLAPKPLSQNQSFIEPSPALELSSIEPLSPQPPPLTTAITSSPTVSSSARNEPPTNSPLIQKLDNAVGAHSEIQDSELEKKYNALVEEIQDQKIMADLNTLSYLDNLFGSNGEDAITKLHGDPHRDPHYYKNINKVIEHQNNRIQELKNLLQLSNRKVYIPGEKQDDYLFSYTINLGTGIELKEWIPNYKDFSGLYNGDVQFNPNFFKLKIQKIIYIIKTNTQLKNYLIMIYNLYKQLNDLFEKFRDQVIFVYSPYNYLTKKIIININADPIEVIPGNDSIHIWGANVTNWNLLPCDPYSRTFKRGGSCDTICDNNNNINGSGQAKNIGYQTVGIFGIVTMPVDNSDILNLESVSLTNKCYNPPIIPLFIYINFDDNIYVLDYKNMGTKGTIDKQYYIYYRNNNNGIALFFTTDKSFIQKYILLDLPQQQKFRYSINNNNNNGFNDVINIFINQINTLPTTMEFSNIGNNKILPNKIVVKISFNRPSLEQSPTLLPPTPPPPSAPTSLQSPGAPPPPPPKGGNNSPKFKKKYTYKYMARRKGRRIRSRKQRGGVFGASQWAPALIGNNITEQETALQNNLLDPNSSILNKMNTYQGGSKGGNIGNVLAQGAVPASLFAANYMYSPGRKSRKRKSCKKNKKASRKFRLF